MQQQPPPQKNLLLFLVLMFTLVMAWNWIQQAVFKKPVQPIPTEEDAVPTRVVRWDMLPPQGVAGQVAILAALSDAGPASHLGQLIAWTAVADWSSENPHLWRPKSPEPKPVPVVAEPAPETIVLGNPNFNLQATFTSRGGTVSQVILNKFQEADRLGLPVVVPEADGPPLPKKLELVPLDDEASFLLYHFPDPTGLNPVPVDTLGIRNWKVQKQPDGGDAEEQTVVFERTIPLQGMKVIKTFTLRKEAYHVDLEVRIERLPGFNGDAFFRYQLTGAHGLPIEGEWYTSIYRNALIGLIENNSVERMQQDSRTIGIQDGGTPVYQPKTEKSHIGYAGIVNQYFAGMIVVSDRQDKDVVPDFVEWVRPTREGIDNKKKPFLDDITVRVNTVVLKVTPDRPVVHRYLLYLGPAKVRLLGHLSGTQAVSDDEAVTRALVERYENTLHLNTLTDYHSPGPVGWFFNKIGWSGLLILTTNLMHSLLGMLYSIFHNYGICIILLTVLVRGSMFPFSRRQAIASAKIQEKMAVLAPDIKKLEEKFKNDPLGLHNAKNELMLKHGVNPLAMMGSCWMLLLQMPVLMGLYYALQESIHFRLASFLWIENLAAPDMLIKWGENIPMLSRPADQGGMLYLGPFFNILPLLAVALMIMQQKVMTPPPTDEQQAMQQKTMKWMTVLFGFLFYKMAAGLCIYFIASGLWGLSERKLLPKKNANPGASDDKPRDDKGGGGGRGGRGGPSGRGNRGKQRGSEVNGDGVVQKIKDWWSEVLKQASKK